MNMTPRLAVTLNAFGLMAVAAVLVAAFAFQFALAELPCPLCLLQRVAFTALAIGPVLNLRFGPRPSHYALSLLAALIGMVASGRQVLLHIMPGDPGYGSAFIGMHYYSWAFVVFAAASLLIGIVMLFDQQFTADAAPAMTPLAKAAVVLIMVVTFANVVSGFVECGTDVCPDNPVSYRLFGET
jgi:disulfide bond formation protein DsbB